MEIGNTMWIAYVSQDKMGDIKTNFKKEIIQYKSRLFTKRHTKVKSFAISINCHRLSGTVPPSFYRAVY